MTNAEPRRPRIACAAPRSFRKPCALSGLVFLVACSSPARVPPRPLGATDHLAVAAKCEEDAKRHEALAEDAEARKARDGGVICGDRALAMQANSGGAPLTPQPPCWTTETDAIQRHRSAATRLRADARTHRALARQLVGAAREACESLPENELVFSPFAHADDIRSVEAVVEGDRVRGARIRFEPVAGLDAAWLRRALVCHQALAALSGFTPTYMPESPAAVADAEITAVDTAAGPEVVIRASDPAAALVIYARAEALVVEP
jgi:hypothetical protein